MCLKHHRRGWLKRLRRQRIRHIASPLSLSLFIYLSSLRALKTRVWVYILYESSQRDLQCSFVEEKKKAFPETIGISITIAYRVSKNRYAPWTTGVYERCNTAYNDNVVLLIYRYLNYKYIYSLQLLLLLYSNVLHLLIFILIHLYKKKKKMTP